jgi:hypothetical protein
MKCANPTCNHGIGLVSYRRGFLGKRRFCCKPCRDYVAVERAAPRKQERIATYVEWLFVQPAASMQPKLAAVRVRAR